MKTEAEIPDIKREEIIESMAAQLLGALYESDPDDPDPDAVAQYDRKKIGQHLRAYFDKRINALALEAVRAGLDDTIKQRISDAVDTVLTAGWQATNSYGEPTGTKLDLRARVSELLTKSRGDSYHRDPPVLDRHIQAAVENFLKGELEPVIAAAREKLKTNLDAKVMKTVADTIANAVGLR